MATFTFLKIPFFLQMETKLHIKTCDPKKEILLHTYICKFNFIGYVIKEIENICMKDVQVCGKRIFEPINRGNVETELEEIPLRLFFPAPFCTTGSKYLWYC